MFKQVAEIYEFLDIIEITTSRVPLVCHITTRDITPIGTCIDHMNNIMQPVIATDAPVVGIAITAEAPVPGCTT